MEMIWCLAMGIGLAAACGFRVFLPLLAISVAAMSGHMSLGPGFAWMGTLPAVLVFGTATVLEIVGYYVPWVDHLLDTVASPAAVVAGTMAMAASVQGMSPLTTWTLAIIAGGGAAAGVQALTVGTRAASTALTGGLGNPVVATIELVASVVLAVLAVVAPLLAVAAAVVLTVWLIRKFIRRRPTGVPAPQPGEQL